MTKNDKNDKMTKNFFKKIKIVQKRISQKKTINKTMKKSKKAN